MHKIKLYAKEKDLVIQKKSKMRITSQHLGSEVHCYLKIRLKLKK